MHWIAVVAFIAFAAVVLILAWSIWAHSRVKSHAEDLAHSAGDKITSKVRELANEFLDQVRVGQDLELAAADFREASQELIPGKKGSLPCSGDVQQLMKVTYHKAVTDSKRRVLAVMIGGTTGIAAIAIVICAILFQVYSSNEGAAPVHDRSPQQFQYAQPVITR